MAYILYKMHLFKKLSVISGIWKPSVYFEIILKMCSGVTLFVINVLSYFSKSQGILVLNWIGEEGKYVMNTTE